MQIEYWRVMSKNRADSSKKKKEEEEVKTKFSTTYCI